MKPTICLVCLMISSFIILFTSSTLVTSQDSCASNSLNVTGIKFNTTSLLCVPAWQDHNFTLRYGEASPNLWSFVVSYPTSINSYAAIGFSNNGSMVGSSAIVGWIEPGPSGGRGMKEYYLGGKSGEEVVPDKGDLEWINEAILYNTSTQLGYITFQLKLQSNVIEPSPFLLFAIGSAGFFPSPPNFQLIQHIDRVSFKMDYSSAEPPTSY